MRNHKLLLILLAVLAIAGCRHGKQETQTQDIQDATETMADSYADSSATSADTVAVVARGDKKIVLSRGGRLDISLEGVHLRAAEGTLLHDGEYSVTALSEEELPPMGGMMENVTGGSGRGYRLLPGGEHFAPYAELRVKYDKAKIPVGYSPEDIFTSYYDISTHKWTRLYRQEVDTVNCEIVSLTSHFTDFVNEILKAPEMPETHAYVPTTLSDIKAGEPLGGLTLMQPPSANNMGTANMSLPIDIPAGRHGMQPSLALTYSNSRGNGWLGIGWDIEIPAITVDTRWGVPRYSSDNESEIYLKDGEQMTTRDGQGQWRALPHRTNQPQPRLSGNIQFFPLVDESADSVVRHGDTPLNYWWSVTHRNGVTDYYGSRNGQVDYQSVLRNDDGNIAYWPLTESEDTYGNKVRYYYDIVTSSDQQPGKQIYVSRINYTGFGNQEGRFNIIFDRNCNERIDKIVSGRYGFKEVTAATLGRIRIEYWTDTTHERKRAYYFITENSRASQYKTRLTDVVN
ncbi:MAG: hypothetical protein J6Y33_03750, partial [Prevotella sp.]|nr:hypothetical protein [Prevotella sp.]